MRLVHGFVVAVGRLLWLAVLLGALFGALTLALTNATASGAPQQAAGAAIAVGYGVLPYVLARAWDALFRSLPHD
jgi:hypothetical protein